MTTLVTDESWHLPHQHTLWASMSSKSVVEESLEENTGVSACGCIMQALFKSLGSWGWSTWSDVNINVQILMLQLTQPAAAWGQEESLEQRSPCSLLVLREAAAWSFQMCALAQLHTCEHCRAGSSSHTRRVTHCWEHLRCPPYPAPCWCDRSGRCHWGTASNALEQLMGKRGQARKVIFLHFCVYR